MIGSGPVAAVDVGGTTMKGALLAADGALLVRRTMPSFAVRGDALASLQALLASLVAGVDGPVRVGVATPGLVLPATGEVAYAANLGWTRLPLRDRLEAALGVPVAVDHDARAAALAELVVQRAERPALDAFLFVPVGTGLAAAVVVDGRPVVGATGAAGEIGHMVVVPDGAPCGCGLRGCAEAYASASGLGKRYRVHGGDAHLDAAGIVSRLGTDAAAALAWTEATDALGAVLAAVTATLDPALIVLGGGLAEAGEVLLDPVRAAMGRGLTWRTVPELARTAIGPQAGLIGAALLPLDDAERAFFARAALAALRAS